MKRILALVLALALLPLCAHAQAPAVDVTDACAITASTREHLSRLHNGGNRTFFETTARGEAFIEIRSPEPLHHMYLQWMGIPDPWVLQEERDGQWVDIGVYGLDGFVQEYVALSGETDLRIVRRAPEGRKKGSLALYELSVFGAGSVPAHVHVWRKAERADLMVVSAHPDDEYIFMGGVIPTYAGERQMDVLVVYLTYGRELRIEELLNGLWLCGVRIYPMLETRRDVLTKTLGRAYEFWDRDELCAYLVELIRTYRPRVLLSHDVDGEYGHGAHKAAADLCMFAYDHSGNADYLPGTGEPWALDKLYLHMYEQNQQTFDWGVPLDFFGGQTALQVAQQAFACHLSQQGGEVTDSKNRRFVFKVREGGYYDNALFGLYGSRVGEDITGGDLFENVVP